MTIVCKCHYQQQKLQLYSFVLFSCVLWNVDAYNVVIKSPQTALIGSYANFTATLYDDEVMHNYKYTWKDNANPQHFMETYSKKPYSSWSINYPFDESIIGVYEVSVEVDKQLIFYINIASSKVSINVTNKLGGDLKLIQGNISRTEQYVSTKQTVNHTIVLPPEEYNYLKNNGTDIQTYWYQNCTYLGVSNGLSYEAAYNQSNATYFIEALTVVFFKKPSNFTTSSITNPTTTTPPTLPTAAIAAVTKASAKTVPNNLSNNTNILENNTSTSTPNRMLINSTTTAVSNTTEMSKKVKREILPTIGTMITNRNGTSEIQDSKKTEIIEQHITTTPTTKTKITRNTQNPINISSVVVNPKLHPGFITAQQQDLMNSVSSRLMLPPPFDCTNKEILASNVTKPAYIGYYTRIVTPKDPISNFTFSKKTWLEQGDILNMNLKCNGSPPIEYCTLVFNAPYNATGEETCVYYMKLTECNFNFTRYFSESKTVLFFIRNQVSNTVNQVTINIYEIKKQSQLSVVVVPVSFTLVAIILVVFGVYYYVQKQTRFNVEVADFNFGETQSVDMEYKTFHQRLYESILEALPQRWKYRTNTFSGSENDSVGGSGTIANNLSNNNIQYNTLN